MTTNSSSFNATRVLGTAFILATGLFVPSSLAQEQQTTYDCRTGCSLDANINGPPVCGQDNLTYLNECLAFCQNVAVLQYGPCEQDSSIAEETEVSTDSEVITMEIMTRFISRGYRFVAKHTKWVSQPDKLEETVVVNSTTMQESATTAVVEEIEPYFVLFTSEGYEYAYRSTESLPSYPSPTPAYMGMQERLLRRNLAVIGVDTRTVVADTKAFPYRTIGEADFGGEGGCTLTMISRNAALTAGHCVWSVQNKAAIGMLRIAPARYRDTSSRTTIEPYGTWAVETTQTFGQFKATGDATYDMAVVTFKPATRSYLPNCPYVYPGDVVGFLSIDRARTSGGRVSDNRLATSTITGYGADQPDGTMSTSGICSKAWESDNERFAYHYCDTFGGNSGSAVITSTNVVLGDHAYGYYDSNNVGVRNGAVMFTGELYDSVYDWAGLGDTQEACGLIAGPEPAEDCACTNFQDRFFLQMVCFILNRDTCFRRKANNGG